MWLILISILFFSSVCHGWSEVINNYETSSDTIWSAYDEEYTSTKSGYWMTGQQSHHDDDYEDRQFKWRYGRPIDPNTDYYYNEATIDLGVTGYDTNWVRYCTSSDYAIHYIRSWHDDDNEDRQFDIKCKRLPIQFKLESCVWTGVQNELDEALDYTCDNGVLFAIDSSHDDDNEDRVFSFDCCSLRNTPMDISSSYGDDRVVTQITSNYQSDSARITTTSTFGKPNWYKDGSNTVNNKYSLTNTRSDVTFWTRICPRNGAFTSITQNTDGTFSFECAQLINEVKMSECQWTDYLNDFKGDFTQNCDEDGAIRGLESYYSPSSDDRRFKIYCCIFKRETYTVNTNIRIKAKTDEGEYDKSDAVILFDLCWNNYLYQSILIMSAVNTWFTTDDVIQYGECGNERTITVSTDSVDEAKLSDIAVQGSGVDYVINAFDVYESPTSNTTHQDDFVLDKDGVAIMDVIVKFPDDYLTACATSGGGTGCTGSLYNLDNYQQYLITLTPCSSFTLGTDIQIGVVLRGTNGNLDKEILTGPVFDQMPAGTGNIGELIHISVEYESGTDFCVEKLTLSDPYNGNREFGKDYFGDGIILSDDCRTDGYFRFLTGIQYVPCYDKPFRITTYETSLYTSVQIHACKGENGGISAINSAQLSLTITGISKDDTFVSSDLLSLKSSLDWADNLSRDYTLQLSGHFEKIALITLTNDDVTDALCVDSVLINGQDAFLSDYWVGATPDHDNIRTLPAVLQWPICKVELTTTIDTEVPLPVDPESVATSTCVNTNRLVSVQCQISQTFETYEEVSWNQQTGQQVTNDITMEAGTTTSVSVSATVSAKVGTEEGVEGGGVSAKATTETGVSETVGGGRDWSSSMSSSQGTTTMDITTDGKVNGETVSITCSGSVTVPPSQQISYSMLIDHSEATLTTLTDIKMTKCSAYLYGDDHFDTNDYIYIYGIVGYLTVKDATNCYVSFSQAEQVSPKDIKCGEERALATREWATYVPQCDKTDPTKYMKCQCAFGDKRTSATCGCVDETKGNLKDTEEASVVYETDTYAWFNWCDEHCGNDSYNAPNAAATEIKVIDVNEVIENNEVVEDNEVIEEDEVIDNFKNNAVNISENSSTNLLFMAFLVVAMFGIIIAIITYVVNSCISCKKGGSRAHDYQSVRRYTDTEADNSGV